MTFSLAPLSMEKLRESRETSGIANCAWILTQNDDEKKNQDFISMYTMLHSWIIQMSLKLTLIT